MDLARILLVDDDPGCRAPIRDLFSGLGWKVEEAADLVGARLVFDRFRPDLVLLDYSLPDGTALDLLPILRRQEPDVSILILTGHAEIDRAVASIKAGADQFLTKPAELPVLLDLAARALEGRRSARRERADTRRSDRSELDPFAGESAASRELAHEASVAAGAESPVLLLGETGTGKGVLARWIHAQGRRAREAFVDLNCAGLSHELLDSELFGHARGAFTGAVQAKTGLFEVADRGSLFLDEIGDIETSVQPKILKAVEDRRFRRLGEIVERRVDVRLIAATHRDLNVAVREGRFRSDLLFRLNTLQLRLAPLRERRADLPALAEAVLARLRRETGRAPELAPTALAELGRYDWPGNIRELRNVLERATLFARGGRIEPSDLRFDATAPGAAVGPEAAATLGEVERRHIERALAAERGQVDRAAERLGIPRSTLYQRLKEYGLSASSFRSGATGSDAKSS